VTIVKTFALSGCSQLATINHEKKFQAQSIEKWPNFISQGFA
jgi:hypothetical protein